MSPNGGDLDRIAAAGAVAVIRSQTSDEAIHRGHTLVAHGINVLEVAFTTPDAAHAISTISKSHPDALVGAGTILDEATARLAILAGARFLLSPCISLPVIRTAHRYGITVVPGVQTPTEVMTALEMGADAVKLFPASTFGPPYLQAVRAALPHVAVIPTGGLSIRDAPGWLDAGAIAVGIGGALTGGPMEETADRAAELCRLLRSRGSN